MFGSKHAFDFDTLADDYPVWPDFHTAPTSPEETCMRRLVAVGEMHERFGASPDPSVVATALGVEGRPDVVALLSRLLDPIGLWR